MAAPRPEPRTSCTTAQEAGWEQQVPPWPQDYSDTWTKGNHGSHCWQELVWGQEQQFCHTTQGKQFLLGICPWGWPASPRTGLRVPSSPGWPILSCPWAQSWQPSTIPCCQPHACLLLLLGLLAARVDLGQRLSAVFLFLSCLCWQKGMCQDSTEGPLSGEEGQTGNGRFWFNYVGSVHKCTDTQSMSRQISVKIRAWYTCMNISSMYCTDPFESVGNSMFAFLLWLIASQFFIILIHYC